MGGHIGRPDGTSTHPDRDQFRARLTADVVRFVEG
jgi:hypothetical protein